MGFNMLFYIIFGTNLLTEVPVQIVVICLFQCFVEKEYQTESKRNETFARIFLGTNAIQETWSGSLEEKSTRDGAQSGHEAGGRAPRGVGMPPTLVSTSLLS